MANKKSEIWDEAKRKCKLNDEDIGLNPKSLIKNIPSKSEPWKAPVKEWIHEIAAKREKKARQRLARKEKKKSTK